MATDPVVSRELKSLQEELATARKRSALSADRPAEPAVGRGPGAVIEVTSDSAALASRSEGPSAEQELRRQLSDLVKEISDFVDDAEKHISEHPAMSIVAAMLLGIVIGSLLGRR